MKDVIPMTIFGKEFQVYTGSCCSAGSAKRTLYVEVTDMCNAKCGFCSLAKTGGLKKRTVLDPGVLWLCLDELVKAGAIDRVSLTGGEPLLPGNDRLYGLFDALEQSGIDYYALTTNGTFLERSLPVLDHRQKLKYVNVSRHSFSNAQNREIFGTDVPDIIDVGRLFSMLADGKRKFRLNCTITNDISRVWLDNYLNIAMKHGIDNFLFRAEYFGGAPRYIKDMFGSMLGGLKESTKCRCFYGFIGGAKVEFRAVDARREFEIELEHKYIRNFVLHSDGKLRGGWSDEAVLIADLSV